MTLIEKIREATRPLHEALDNEMMPRIKNIHTTDDYIQLLIAFYGFFKPVYDAMDAHLRTSSLPDYKERRGTNDILHNLTSLHYDEEIKKICRHLPRICDNASAFGALYVMEGSALGGLVIKKMIAEQTGLTDEQLSFFAGYGKETRQRWNVFITALNNAAHNSEEEEAAITAARETFTYFRDWLNLNKQ